MAEPTKKPGDMEPAKPALLHPQPRPWNPSYNAFLPNTNPQPSPPVPDVRKKLKVRTRRTYGATSDSSFGLPSPLRHGSLSHYETWEDAVNNASAAAFQRTMLGPVREAPVLPVPSIEHSHPRGNDMTSPATDTGNGDSAEAFQRTLRSPVREAPALPLPSIEPSRPRGNDMTSPAADAGNGDSAEAFQITLYNPIHVAPDFPLPSIVHSGLGNKITSPTRDTNKVGDRKDSEGHFSEDNKHDAATSVEHEDHGGTTSLRANFGEESEDEDAGGISLIGLKSDMLDSEPWTCLPYSDDESGDDDDDDESEEDAGPDHDHDCRVWLKEAAAAGPEDPPPPVIEAADDTEPVITAEIDQGEGQAQKKKKRKKRSKKPNRKRLEAIAKGEEAVPALNFFAHIDKHSSTDDIVVRSTMSLSTTFVLSKKLWDGEKNEEQMKELVRSSAYGSMAQVKQLVEDKGEAFKERWSYV
jgi:hypothetical protein